MDNSKGNLKENNGKSVAVLLSTYNGSKYIEEQLYSLVTQTYNDITIFIRDDGSTDSTVELIRRFIEKNTSSKKIILLDDKDGNLGYGGSFYKLANKVNGFNYYAFCDQDDYWYPNKIELAVDAFGKSSSNELVCYASNFYIGDSSLEIRCKAQHDSISLQNETLGRIFFEGISVGGMVMVINDSLRRVCFEINGMSNSYPYAHDKWISLVLLGMKGRFIYDSTPTAIYRRHDSTTSAFHLELIPKLKWRIKNVLNSNYLWRIRQLILLYKKFFGEQITSKAEEVFLNTFTKNGKEGYIKRLLYPYRLKKSAVDEILLRVLFLIGKYERT